MRIFERIAFLAALALGVGFVPASGLDGNTRSRPAELPSATDAFRSGTEALRAGENTKAVTSLEYAAEQGVTAAKWQLGRMYARGEGVLRSDLRAFEYFGQIANSQLADGLAEFNPNSPRARIVSNAFVAVGQYYLDGIPDSQIKPDPGRARRMFSYAAIYFGDADAQYRLGRLLLSDKGGPRDPRNAARWLKLAAGKDQHAAQAILGDLLFRGTVLPRQAGKGLMYLIIARDGIAKDPWINDLYEAAIAQANDDDRAAARIYLQQWLRGARD